MVNAPNVPSKMQRREAQELKEFNALVRRSLNPDQASLDEERFKRKQAKYYDIILPVRIRNCSKKLNIENKADDRYYNNIRDIIHDIHDIHIRDIMNDIHIHNIMNNNNIINSNRFIRDNDMIFDDVMCRKFDDPIMGHRQYLYPDPILAMVQDIDPDPVPEIIVNNNNQPPPPRNKKNYRQHQKLKFPKHQNVVAKQRFQRLM